MVQYLHFRILEFPLKLCCAKLVQPPVSWGSTQSFRMSPGKTLQRQMASSASRRRRASVWRNCSGVHEPNIKTHHFFVTCYIRLYIYIYINIISITHIIRGHVSTSSLYSHYLSTYLPFGTSLVRWMVGTWDVLECSDMLENVWWFSQFQWLHVVVLMIFIQQVGSCETCDIKTTCQSTCDAAMHPRQGRRIVRRREWKGAGRFFVQNHGRDRYR